MPSRNLHWSFIERSSILRSRWALSFTEIAVLTVCAARTLWAAPSDDSDGTLTDIPDGDEPASPPAPGRRQPPASPPASGPPAPLVTNPPPAWYQPLRPEDQPGDNAAPTAPERPVSQRRDRENPRRRTVAPGSQPAPSTGLATPAPDPGSPPALLIPRQRPALPPYV